jgi:hypothetical protein
LADTSLVTTLAVSVQNVGSLFSNVENDARLTTSKIQGSIAALSNYIVSSNATLPWLMSSVYPATVFNITSISGGIFESLHSTFCILKNISYDYINVASSIDSISDDLYYKVRISNNSQIISSDCQNILKSMNSDIFGDYSNQLRICRTTYLNLYSAYQASIDRNLTNIRRNFGSVSSGIFGCRLFNFSSKANFVACANNAVSLSQWRI